MKVAVVTGASAGIGLAIAERFAKSGWQVAILARGAARLDEAKRQFERHGGGVLTIEADVADPAAVSAAADRVIAEFGRIDAWVNNAMTTVVAPAHEITPEEYQQVAASTYLSQVYGTLAALRQMRRQGKGAIIQVSSGLAIRAAPLQAAYCAAKAAVGGFTDSLRSELIAEKSPITLSVVYLPGVNTPQPTWARNRTGHEQVIPDPLFDPRLCAEAVYSSVRNPQREIWVGRSTMMMALGQALAPGIADRKAASMMQAQQGDAMPPRDGNLAAPAEGLARIDGPRTRDVVGSRSEYITSRDVRLLKVAAAGGLLLAGAALRALTRGTLGKRG
ncbi:Short-chain dehydrogenase [Aureimonas altamirensis DSM 21988]|uniref:Short-chain dehydrogenase n=1 Tax=Aureimonas altamirensis DSM 21988 TaxID=1121026 RepID=A0ABY1I5V6_9HYPH|nr:SDR family oxidoreductase [Aureimonas altamirensis]SHI64494.1 Short-chain dehydrogenase [Aureimonas altamirensis DSM 21988]